MMFLRFALCVMLGCSPAYAYDLSKLQYPVEDAKEAAASGRIEFVAIVMPEGLRFPGLSDEQASKAYKEYPVRELNHRWKTYQNVEDDSEMLMRLEGYGRRYNLMMWKLSYLKKRQDFLRYRY